MQLFSPQSIRRRGGSGLRRVGPFAYDEKDDMIHELDTLIVNHYGESESPLIHIFKTFHEGWNYQARLDGVPRHFRAWRSFQ